MAKASGSFLSGGFPDHAEGILGEVEAGIRASWAHGESIRARESGRDALFKLDHYPPLQPVDWSRVADCCARNVPIQAREGEPLEGNTDSPSLGIADHSDAAVTIIFFWKQIVGGS